MTMLRRLLPRPGLLTLPGIFDGVSARLAAAASFPELCMIHHGAIASARLVDAATVLPVADPAEFGAPMSADGIERFEPVRTRDTP